MELADMLDGTAAFRKFLEENLEADIQRIDLNEKELSPAEKANRNKHILKKEG